MIRNASDLVPAGQQPAHYIDARGVDRRAQRLEGVLGKPAQILAAEGPDLALGDARHKLGLEQRPAAGHAGIERGARRGDESEKAVNRPQRLDRIAARCHCAAGCRTAKVAAVIADKDATIDDLRRRLDPEATDRRKALDRIAAAQERIAALLTDQRTPPPVATPARRSWWPWRR